MDGRAAGPRVAADLGIAARLHRVAAGTTMTTRSPRSGCRTSRRTLSPGWPLEPDSDRTPVEQYLADVVRFHHAADVQEAILAGTDASLIWALGSYLDELNGGEPSAELASAPGGVAGGDPQSAPVGPAHAHVAPLCRGRRGRRRTSPWMIRAGLEGFLERLPLFRPSWSRSLTFLVVPPEQGKDVDNIALTALPIAHEVLRPHIAPYLLPPFPTVRMTRRPPRAEALARLKSVNAFSVRASSHRAASVLPGSARRDIAPRAGTACPRELVAPREHLPWQGDRPGRPACPDRRQHVERLFHPLARPASQVHRRSVCFRKGWSRSASQMPGFYVPG